MPTDLPVFIGIPDDASKLVTERGLGKVIRPDKENGTFALKTMQDYVGGYIEVAYQDENVIVIVNEEGAIRGLPANAVASFSLSGLAGYPMHVYGSVLFLRPAHLE